MEQEKKSGGEFFGLIVIILILVIGGMYILHSEYKNAINKKPSTAINQNSSLK
jgi:uncharacterized protein YneF (UPF0154 family)